MRLAVIGGGMAGLCAGIAAAERGATVTLFERNDAPGKKLLMTGNGRCNLGNEALKKGFPASEFYHGDTDLAARVLGVFEFDDVLAFMESLGVSVVSEGGLLYPRGMQASSVRDALVRAFLSKGGRLRNNTKVTGIEDVGDGYLLTLGFPDGSMTKEGFNHAVLACGGRSHPETGSDGLGFKLCKKLGIPVKKPLPALTRFCFKDEDLALAAGARVKGSLELYIDGAPSGSDFGEIQFLKNAVSGIVAFQLSSPAVRALDAGKSVTLYADCFTEKSEMALFDMLSGLCHLHGDYSLMEVLSGFMNSRLAGCVIRRAGLKKEMSSCSASEEELLLLCRMIKRLEIKVSSMGGFGDCQVTCGGIEGSALDDNLMIKDHPGLYAAGEILDVDGICGGFNLQFAMAGGFVAGSSAAV